MNNHVNAVCKSIHYHIRALRHIRSSVSKDMAKMIACALVGSRLDYTDFVLSRATQKNIPKLQKAQNLLARVVTNSPQSCSPRTLLQQLHWLPIKRRIDFKIANITFRTLHCSQPAYLRSSFHACHSTRSFRLSSLLRLSAHHLALAALASQPLKSGTFSLSLSVPVPVLTPSVVISRPITANRPSTPFNLSPDAPQIRLC